MKFSALKALVAFIMVQSQLQNVAGQQTPGVASSEHGPLGVSIVDGIHSPVFTNYQVNLSQIAPGEFLHLIATTAATIQESNYSAAQPSIAYGATSDQFIMGFTYDAAPNDPAADSLPFVDFYTSKNGKSMVILGAGDDVIEQRSLNNIEPDVVYTSEFVDNQWRFDSVPVEDLTHNNKLTTEQSVAKLLQAKRTLLMSDKKHTAKDKYPQPTEKGVNLLSAENQQLIRDLYKQATPSEVEFLDYMLSRMDNPEQVVHFFLGGHIELHGDAGKSYQQWIKKFGANGEDVLKGRFSSHQSDSPQYAMSGPIVSEALFGTRNIQHDDHSDVVTWVQLESHPVGGLREWMKSATEFAKQAHNTYLHLVSYFDYKWNQNNVGPHGKSTFIEKNPLRIYVGDITASDAAHNLAAWKKMFLTEPGAITEAVEAKMGELNAKDRLSNS